MKTVTFGEVMLRLSPPGHGRFVQTPSLDVSFGGGEANVAVALAGFGFDSFFLSKIPGHEIGQACVNDLRRYGVSDRFIVRGGDRLGIYFLETGASQRGSKVLYDRAGSAVTTLVPDEVTRIKTGEVAITAILLVATKILRADSFYKQEVQHAA